MVRATRKERRNAKYPIFLTLRQTEAMLKLIIEKGPVELHAGGVLRGSGRSK
jgi:hypothetical protein